MCINSDLNSLMLNIKKLILAILASISFLTMKLFQGLGSKGIVM